MVESITVRAGVRKIEKYWTDDYIGTAEALVAAGLVQSTQFPGVAAHQGKRSIRISPDGAYHMGAKNAHKLAGTKVVKHHTVGRFEFMVSITTSAEERDRRYQAMEADEEEERQAKASPCRSGLPVKSDAHYLRRLEAIVEGFMVTDDIRARMRRAIVAEFGPRSRTRRALPTGWSVIAGG